MSCLQWLGVGLEDMSMRKLEEAAQRNYIRAVNSSSQQPLQFATGLTVMAPAP